MTTIIYFGNNSTKHTFGLLKLNTTPATYKDVNIAYSTLSVGNKAVFDAFLTLVTTDGSLTITNCPFQFDGDLVRPGTVSPTTNTTKNYLTMSAGDKTKVDNFGTLLAL